MVPYRFSSLSEMPEVREQTLLPALSRTLRARLVPFPAQSAGLTPVSMPPIEWQVPRFSLLRADATLVSGFRLHEVEGRQFTDASVVGDAQAESDLFNRKFGARQPEDLNFLTSDPPVAIERDGPVLVLSSDEPANFGSWIYRFLPKFLLAREAERYAAVFAYAPGFGLDFLNSAGLRCELIPHNPRLRHIVARPVIPTLPAPHVFLRPEIVAALRELIPPGPPGARLGERLYVSRRLQAINRPGFRVLINETEIVERLRAIGFAEFVPERYSIAEQIGIFAAAKVIVGCGGSNMFGCVFARDVELIVDLESTPDWLFAHLNLFESLGCPYAVALGTRESEPTETPHVNWLIDAAAVIEGVRTLTRV